MIEENNEDFKNAEHGSGSGCDTGRLWYQKEEVRATGCSGYTSWDSQTRIRVQRRPERSGNERWYVPLSEYSEERHRSDERRDPTCTGHSTADKSRHAEESNDHARPWPEKQTDVPQWQMPCVWRSQCACYVFAFLSAWSARILRSIRWRSSQNDTRPHTSVVWKVARALGTWLATCTNSRNTWMRVN